MPDRIDPEATKAIQTLSVGEPWSDEQMAAHITAAYAERIAALERVVVLARAIREHDYRLRCEGSGVTNLSNQTFLDLTDALAALDILE